MRAFFGTSSLSFGPPIILTETQADDIAGRVERALASLSDELRADGRWPGPAAA